MTRGLNSRNPNNKNERVISKRTGAKWGKIVPSKTAAERRLKGPRGG